MVEEKVVIQDREVVKEVEKEVEIEKIIEVEKDVKALLKNIHRVNPEDERAFGSFAEAGY